MAGLAKPGQWPASNFRPEKAGLICMQTADLQLNVVYTDGENKCEIVEFINWFGTPKLYGKLVSSTNPEIAASITQDGGTLYTCTCEGFAKWAMGAKDKPQGELISMAGKQSKTNKYGLEVVTFHELNIDWRWIGKNGDDCDYRDQVFDRIDAHWVTIRGDFPRVDRIWYTGPMGHRFHSNLRLRGDNPEVVLAAGQEMAKKIFAHKYVEPGISVPEIPKFRSKLKPAG
jgi:hypothetical protein